MSTLPIGNAHLPQIWPLPGLVRVGAFFALVADIFAEAHQSMREANKKYPFAGV